MYLYGCLGFRYAKLGTSKDQNQYNGAGRRGAATAVGVITFAAPAKLTRNTYRFMETYTLHNRAIPTGTVEDKASGL